MLQGSIGQNIDTGVCTVCGIKAISDKQGLEHTARTGPWRGPRALRIHISSAQPAAYPKNYSPACTINSAPCSAALPLAERNPR